MYFIDQGAINYREVGPTDGEPLIFVPGAFVNGGTYISVQNSDAKSNLLARHLAKCHSRVFQQIQMLRA
jgi:hypothetical protein